MTCKEKLKALNPTWDQEDFDVVMREECPHMSLQGAEMPDYCDSGECPERCVECWNREVPDITDEARNIVKSTILDSGDRTEFESGAVRDMREGKGRCDLMPLEVIADCYEYFARYHNGDGSDEAQMFRYIKSFLQTNDTKFLIDALDLFSAFDTWSTMFLEVAKHFEEGAKKYGPDNWRQGIPTYCYIDSAIRHYLKWIREDKDEAHSKAFVWNLMCCIWEVDYGEEWRKSKSANN